jgi:hypothetical protein
VAEEGNPVNDDPNNKAGSDSKGDDEPPRILKAVITRKQPQSSRRDFFRQALAGAATAATAASVGVAASGCGGSAYDIQVDDKDQCRCHAVCVCDSQGEKGRTMEARYEGAQCTCDLVCVCESVCNCNSEGGSSGGTYYYPV